MPPLIDRLLLAMGALLGLGALASLRSQPLPSQFVLHLAGMGLLSGLFSGLVFPLLQHRGAWKTLLGGLIGGFNAWAVQRAIDTGVGREAIPALWRMMGFFMIGMVVGELLGRLVRGRYVRWRAPFQAPQDQSA